MDNGLNCKGLKEYLELIDEWFNELNSEEKKELLSDFEVEWDEFSDAEKIEIYENNNWKGVNHRVISLKDLGF